MRKLLVLLASLAAVALPASAAAGSTAAGRGGWAIASFDPLPELVAGEHVEVGFRVLQHGVTPVIAADWPGIEEDLGLDVTGPAGTEFVAARADGAPGHFVVDFVVPEGPSVSLEAQWHNGLVLQSEPVAIAVASSGDAAGGIRWLPTVLTGLGLGGLAVAAFDVVQGRRRTRRPALSST